MQVTAAKLLNSHLVSGPLPPLRRSGPSPTIPSFLPVASVYVSYETEIISIYQSLLPIGHDNATLRKLVFSVTRLQ